MKIFELINKNLQSPVNFDFIRKPEESEVLPIITISREKGSGGKIVAAKLAKKLGSKWHYYDREIVERIAKESNIPAEKVKELEHESIPYLQDVFESLLGKDSLSLNSYHRTLLKILYDIGDKGYAIIVGRGANFIFKDALKIRIIAEYEDKIKLTMESFNLSRNEAKKMADKTEAESIKFINNLYNKDITDPHNFDLVIKTSSQLTLEEETDLIAKIAKKRFKL